VNDQGGSDVGLFALIAGGVLVTLVLEVAVCRMVGGHGTGFCQLASLVIPASLALLVAPRLGQMRLGTSRTRWTSHGPARDGSPGRLGEPWAPGLLCIGLLVVTLILAVLTRSGVVLFVGAGASVLTGLYFAARPFGTRPALLAVALFTTVVLGGVLQTTLMNR
jgi:hypothetical protein